MKALKSDKNRQKIEGSQHLEERKEIKWIFHFFMTLYWGQGSSVTQGS